MRWARCTPPPESPQTIIGADGWNATAVAGPGRTSTACSVPVVTSQILRVPSPPVEAIHAPSGLNAQPLTPRGWPEKMARFLPVAVFQIVRPELTEAIQMPSGLTAQALPPPNASLVGVFRAMPVAASQILRVPSPLTETIQVPSGLTAQLYTSLVWPTRVAR